MNKAGKPDNSRQLGQDRLNTMPMLIDSVNSHPGTGSLSGESEGNARLGLVCRGAIQMRRTFRVFLLTLMAGIGWSSATFAGSYGGGASLGCSPIPCGDTYVEYRPQKQTIMQT
ncbi:MAG: hypothetical protein RJA81_246, partial [Planctomycetota bacterium]